MHYRVVLQGRTLGGADIEHVKREFVRVTGLPAKVADNYFDGMPHPVKRQVSQADAERIAATLRAIGAAASVEREVAEGEQEVTGEIRIVANPLISGPPSIIPGMGGATMAATTVSQPRWVRQLREKLPMIAGVVVLALGATQLAPMVDEFVQTLKPAAAPAAPPKRAAAPAPQAAAPAELNASLLHGPWRCTDQRTGIATYWTYQEDGKLIYYGDTFKDGALVASSAKDVPHAWKLADGRLVLAYPQGETESLAVEALTLGNLRYGDARRRIEIDCRRP